MKDINRVIKKTNEQHDPDKHTDPVKLTNKAVNPFNTWSDWYGENGEAVITFITMKQRLFEKWKNQAQHLNISKDLATKNGVPVEKSDTITLYTHREFENNFKGPGIYQESTHYCNDDKVDESYLIIVPGGFMTREMCERYIEKLNKEYNREFYFEDIDYTERHAQFIKGEIDNDDEIEEELDIETVKKLMGFIQ